MVAARAWIVSAFVALVLWPGAAPAQSPAVTDAYNRFAGLYSEGRFEDAARFAERALRLGEQELGPAHATTAALGGGKPRSAAIAQRDDAANRATPPLSPG